VRVTGKLTQAPEGDGAYGFKFRVNDGSGAALIFVNMQTASPWTGFRQWARGSA
jgi:hypothetical protein